MEGFINIAVLFGGNSTEHDISIVSAMHVIMNLNKSKYRVSSIYIDKEGKFASAEKTKENISNLIDNMWEKVFPDNSNYDEIRNTLLNSVGDGEFMGDLIQKKYNIIFPVFHGLNGEDGTIQGLLEFMKIPYIGCGVLASALSIDKEATKLVCKAKGIPVAEYLTIHKHSWESNKENILKEINRKFNLPIYVKPARLGSSIGVREIFDLNLLEESIQKCLEFDNKILIEEAICNPREITVGVNGVQNDVMLSELGEFNNYKEEFFDFEAKYGANSRKGIIPAKVDLNIAEQIRKYSRTIFESFELSGFARLDFFLCNDKVYLNEINTIPGLETHGTFIRIWKSMGITPDKFFDMLIERGFERYKQNEERNLKLDIKF